jgi:hypothetical protein
MKHLKHFKHTLVTCIYMQHPHENTCNIRLIQMKHLEHTLKTYVYSHCNMCNISIYFCSILIYFCNINIKHLQHISETLEINVYNMLFIQCKHLLVASANGGSSPQHGARQRRKEGGCGGGTGGSARKGQVGCAWR